MIILIILIIVLLLSLFLINKTLKKKDNILEDVKLRENTIKNDGFALMLQKEDGTYKESTSSSWPTDMVFNNELSGCIDANGNKIENVLSYNASTSSVKIKTNGTTYCYVYFDLDNSATRYLIENISSEELWNSTLEGDGYRYVGTDPNNYICFGTSDKDTCINDTDKYMYRIIGIFEDENKNNHLKLIKNVYLMSPYSYQWHSNDFSVYWNESDLYKGLNGSYFLTNTEYSYMQDTNWTDKIAIWNYTMASHINDSNNIYSFNAEEIYLNEFNRAGKSINTGEWKYFDGKISLMYLSDYLLSFGTASLGWLHLKYVNVTFSSYNYEWTMSAALTESGIGYAAYVIQTKGSPSGWSNKNNEAVRPVFYLESDVELSSGTGTISDPYIIK